MYPEQYRNLHAHREARIAMLVWGKRYSEQHGGSMDFWESLSRAERNLCRKLLKEIDDAAPESMHQYRALESQARS
jgi:hypothetical protein